MRIIIEESDKRVTIIGGTHQEIDAFIFKHNLNGYKVHVGLNHEGEFGYRTIESHRSWSHQTRVGKAFGE